MSSHSRKNSLTSNVTKIVPEAHTAPSSNHFDHPEQPTSISRIECPICLSDYPADNTVVTIPTCKHAFCTQCLHEYLKNKLDNFQVLKIPCPQSECQVIMAHSVIEQVLGQELFKKHQELVLKKTYNKNLKQRFCPKPGCSKPYYPTRNKEYTNCSCGTSICNTCCAFWHPGKSCLEAMNPEFEIYINMNEIKFCMMCKTPVKRAEGCTHMTCSICDYEWCWTCGREYKPKGKAHQCPQKWSPLPPVEISNARFCVGNFLDTFREVFNNLKVKSCMNRFLLKPWIFLLYLIIWPFFIMFRFEKDLALLIQNGAKRLVLASVMLGLLLLPLVLLILMLSVLGSVVGFICCLTPSPKNERWRKRIGDHFRYTANAVPTQRDTAPVP